MTDKATDRTGAVAGRAGLGVLPVDPAADLTGGLILRDATLADSAAIAEIYAHHVLTSLATFELTAPTAAQIAARRQASVSAGLPWLVAQGPQGVLGYACATPYRPRAAYRLTIEDSVYVAQGCGGRGIGAALLAALIARCEQGQWRQMLAVIGDSDNAASIALHRRMGFVPVGTLKAVGFKFGRWVDTVLMQRPLSAGDTAPPGSACAIRDSR